jgi:hypothetical protein
VQAHRSLAPWDVQYTGHARPAPAADASQSERAHVASQLHACAVAGVAVHGSCSPNDYASIHVMTFGQRPRRFQTESEPRTRHGALSNGAGLQPPLGATRTEPSFPRQLLNYLLDYPSDTALLPPFTDFAVHRCPTRTAFVPPTVLTRCAALSLLPPCSCTCGVIHRLRASLFSTSVGSLRYGNHGILVQWSPNTQIPHSPRDTTERAMQLRSF